MLHYKPSDQRVNFISNCVGIPLFIAGFVVTSIAIAYDDFACSSDVRRTPSVSCSSSFFPPRPLPQFSRERAMGEKMHTQRSSS
jgi:hypothetical protein